MSRNIGSPMAAAPGNTFAFLLSMRRKTAAVITHGITGDRPDSSFARRKRELEPVDKTKLTGESNNAAEIDGLSWARPGMPETRDGNANGRENVEDIRQAPADCISRLWEKHA